MSGTRVTATDLETGEAETTIIEDNYLLICDGKYYLDGYSRYANGTVVLTVKRKA